MRNPFKKAPAEPKFKEARDKYSFAVHIQDSSDTALCGEDTFLLNGKVEVTVEDVLNRANSQHFGWYWCPQCASILTGKTPEFFRWAK